MLDYGGPFHCKPVQYMTGGIAAAALLTATVVFACCRRRKRKQKRSRTPVTSAYPGYPVSFYGRMPYFNVSISIEGVDNVLLSVRISTADRR